MNWEPWTGCYPISEGCANCYFYGPRAKRHGQNSIEKTDKFDWPIRTNAKGDYNIKGNKILATCFATDFFLPEADEWRGEAWAMMKQRPDIDFLILTKRIDRFPISLPADWGAGYDNVNIGCTAENQAQADYRLPLFLSYPPICMGWSMSRSGAKRGAMPANAITTGYWASARNAWRQT